MENHKLSEEINLIKETIEKSKRRFADNGLHYIAWGILTAIASVATYLLISNSVYKGLIWTVANIVGIAFSITINKRRNLGATNFLDKIVGNVWIASIVALIFLLLVAAFSPYIAPRIIPIFPSVILFVAFYITGNLYQDNLLRLISFCWLAAAIVFSLWISINSLLVFAGLLILLQVVPGIIIYKRSKNGKN